MSLQSRLTALAQAVGADIKTLNSKVQSATISLDAVHVVGAVGEPAFQNSWVPSSPATYGGLKFRKDPFGSVRIYGSISGGATGTAVFTLPAGYRPPATTSKLFSNLQGGGSAGSYVAVSSAGVFTATFTSSPLYIDVEFDTETVTQIFSLGPKGDKGDTGDPATAVAAGSWVNKTLTSLPTASTYVAIPLSTVNLTGTGLALNGPETAVIVADAGWYDISGWVQITPGTSGGAWFRISDLAGTKTWTHEGNDAATAVVRYAASFTEYLTAGEGITLQAMSRTAAGTVVGALSVSRVGSGPRGPKGDKGDPGGINVVTTLDWDTALLPNFYRSSNDGLVTTLHGPGDVLNPPTQAGVVSVHENGRLVQRVWDLDYQVAYMRYRNFDGSWTAWVSDLVKPPLFTDAAIGGATPKDGDERYFQNAAMKALGIIWKFRYNASSSSTYKWEFVGGPKWLASYFGATSYTTGTPAYTFGAALTDPKLTIPLSGDYLISWLANATVAGNVPDARCSVFVNGALPAITGAMGSMSTGMYNANLVDELIKTGVVSGQVVDLRLATNTAGSTFTVYDRSLSILPIRVNL